MMKALSSRLLYLCLALAVCVTAHSADAATIVVVNGDAPGEGFNDPTPVVPTGGNPATTLGGARLYAFEYAANIWGALLGSNVVIEVAAQMNPQFCDPGSAVLGSAGAISVFRDFAGAPATATWYSQALANSLAGADLDPGVSDIGATFNSNLNGNPSCLGGKGWYYGVDQNPGTDIDFVTVVLHEIGHGLGFQSFVSLASGAKFNGFNDTYMLNLEQHGAAPADYASMSNAQRVAASKSDPNLHWTGASVQAEAPTIPLTGGMANGHVRMHGPNPQQPGSSVSHWSPAVTPNELMEPAYTGATHDPSLAIALMDDLGWNVDGGQDECFSDGDVDGNAELSPGDALCAFQIFLNGGALPASCDAAGNCEVVAADVNCNENVTPQDALDIFNRWIQGTGGPAECFAAVPSYTSATRDDLPADALFALAIDRALENDGVISIPVTMRAIGGAAAFGFELKFDPTAVAFEGLDVRDAARDWRALAANEVEPGRLIVGGFDTVGLDARDLSELDAAQTVEIATLRLRKIADRPELEPARWLERVIRPETDTGRGDEPNDSALRLPRFNISQPFPNPVHGTSSFVVSTASDEPSRVTVSIYDVNGRLVKPLYDSVPPHGDLTISWDRRDANGQLVSSGIYFVQMKVKSASFVKTRKLAVFRVGPSQGHTRRQRRGSGIVCTGGASPILTCNDVFGNTDGDALCGVDGGQQLLARSAFLWRRRISQLRTSLRLAMRRSQQLVHASRGCQSLSAVAPSPFSLADYARHALAAALIYVGIQSPRAGGHAVEWDGFNERGQRVASGVYIYQLDTGSQALQKRMILLK